MPDPTDLSVAKPSSLERIGRPLPAAPKDKDDVDQAERIAKMISGFSLNGKNGIALTPYPMPSGENDYSNWRAELRRMSPEIEETATSIWRIAGPMTATEIALARFEAKMCQDEIFAPCHQRIRQKRFLVRRQMLAEQALTTWNDGDGEVWTMPEEIWENLHEMDPSFQNAVMDLYVVCNDITNQKALNIWFDATTRIKAIDDSIAKDEARGIFKDHSQTIDALIRTNPNTPEDVYQALIQNTDAYW